MCRIWPMGRGENLITAFSAYTKQKYSYPTICSFSVEEILQDLPPGSSVLPGYLHRGPCQPWPCPEVLKE